MAAPDRPSVAETIARSVASAGIRTVFGLPGGEVVVLVDALRRAGVEFVLTHHENTAAFMASGLAEVTGIPGVCIATLGPGATNMVTGAASALLERAPVVLLTGALARTAHGATTHQALDLNALYGPVTKHSVAITPENAEEAINEALALAGTAPRGSVHLSIPADVAASASGPSRRNISLRTPDRPLTDHAAPLARARRMLAAGTRPAIVVGLGVIQEEASEEVRALAHATGAVVATLPKAKGVFPEDDPRFVGTLEMAGDEIVVDLLKAADVVLTAGVDIVEFDKPWRLPAPVISLDAEPQEPRYWQAEVHLSGALGENLKALTPDRPPMGWSAGRLESHRRSLGAFVRTAGRSLQTWQVVTALRSGLGRSAVATSDVGAHKMVVGQAWPAFEPRTFFMANGLSSMGYSIPVAAAVRMSQPQRPVVAFVGDGGLAMYLGEFETLTRLKLDLVVVVFVDNQLALISHAQAKRSLPFTGTEFRNPDFASIGRAFGIATYNAASNEELERVLPKLIASDGIRLLVAEIDSNDYRF